MLLVHFGQNGAEVEILCCFSLNTIYCGYLILVIAIIVPI